MPPWIAPTAAGLMAFVGMVLVQLSGTVHAADEAIPKLRYRFQSAKYGYRMKIVAKTPEGEEAWAGVLIVETTRTADDQFTLRTVGGAFAEQIRGTPTGFGGFPEFSPPPGLGRIRQPDRWVLDDQGNVLREGSEDQARYLLGPRDLLVIESLPAQAQKTWYQTDDLHLVERSPHSLRRLGPPRVVLVIGHDAKQRTDYSILGVTSDTVRIGKKYQMATISEAKTGRRLTISGSGELQFDRNLGAFKSGDMEYVLETKEDDLKLTVPVTLTYRLMGDTELADYQKGVEATASAEAEAREPSPLRPEERKTLLERLRNGDDREHMAALERLARATVGENPEEIAAAVAPFLGSPDHFVQAAAAKALKVWATPATEAALIEASRSENWMARAPAIEALGRLKTTAAAEAVAAQLPHHRQEAGQALRAMGPVAESATLSLLKERDFWIRVEVHNVLKEIGGAASLAALEQANQAHNTVDQRSFEEALFAIKQRVRAAGLPPATKEDAAAAPANSEPAALRTWHDVSGDFDVEASFLECTDDQVLLRRKDGRRVRIALDQLAESDRAWVRQHGKPQPADAESNAPRTWRDAAGVFELEAVFVKHADNKVTLRKKDGRTVEVPWEQLSPQDQAWVSQQTEPKAGTPPP